MSLVEHRMETGAGQDPRKRQQILEGARKVFHDHGFDAASMNDIARVAGVSKGTLYVYFENKERLFLELIAEEKKADLWPIVSLDHDDRDIEKVLNRFGREFLRLLTRPYYIKAMRTVFSIVERMPEVGADYYSRGPQICMGKLADYLQAQSKAGIVEIDNCLLAAQQFMDLSQAGILRQLLFNATGTPSDEDIALRVSQAVDFFLKVYEPASGRHGRT
ncbi:MAG: TetR/AcrR family transcriptional regulator [Parvibaculaceae bacterium]